QPEGDTVAFALLHGPCAAYHAQACAIYLADAERTQLALVGESGFGRESLQRYQVIPLDVGIPGALAYRTGEPMGRASDWICLPLTYLGAGMGTIVIACPAGLSWGWAEQSHFDGFASAVSLWARAVQLDADPQVASRHRSRDGRSRVGTVALSERQLQVLAGIRQGKPNKVIARELGYSISTIKAEVQHILACLGATNRRDAIVRAGNAGISLPGPQLAGTDLAR
ncbi:MAG: LuxR C-terminal-related transcriptional regulator, partial [Actinomycetales bacterium]